MSQLSPSEKRGLLVISSIFLIGFIIQWSQPYFVQKGLYDYSLQDSVFQKLSSDSSLIEPIKKTVIKSSTNKEKKRPNKKGDLIIGKININTASQKELEKLPRIGPATAKNIIEFRNKNGTFKTLDEITKVKRIGPKTLEKIKPYIVLTD